MSEEKKTHKRKILFRYLILAACILVIAAITVTTVFAVNNWFRSDITIDRGDDNPTPPVTDPDDGNDDDNKQPVEPDKPTVNETTFAYPVANMNVAKHYEFGENKSLSGCYHFHTGIDLAAEAGTDVAVCLDGTVESIVRGDQLDGNKITVLHADGVKSVYTFVEVADGLKTGDTVKRGQKIGSVAQPTGSEYLDEAHLHFEVWKNGSVTDPAEFFELSEK